MLASTVLSLSALLAQAGAPTVTAPCQPHAEQLDEQILVITGCYFEEHMTVLATGQGLVVVDTLTTAAATRRALEQIRDFSDEPVRYLINTHFDIDHYGGNQLFADAAIVGHANCQDHYGAQFFDKAENRQGLEQFIASLPEVVKNAEHPVERRDFYEAQYRSMEEGFDGFSFTPPTLFLESSARIELGSLAIELRHLGPAHSNADLLVLVPDKSLIVAGDMVLGERYTPVAAAAHGGRLSGLISALETVQAMSEEYSRIVPGHGPATDFDAVRAQREYLDSLLSQVRAARRQGKTLEQAKASVRTPGHESALLFEMVHLLNIEAAWTECGERGQVSEW